MHPDDTDNTLANKLTHMDSTPSKRSLEQTRTTRIACDDCGVVQEAEVEVNEEGQVGLRREAHTHDECSVCDATLSLGRTEKMKFI